MRADSANAETISRVVDIGSLDGSGVRHVLEPTEAERAAIARRLGIPAIKSLRGEFLLTPTRGGVDIALNLSAVTERICVASLEPLDEVVHEEIRMAFDRNFNELDTEELGEGDISREPLEGDEIDIGELLVQHLSLSLDPFPRKKDAASLSERFRDAASSSPFSVLKGLADRES